MKTIRIRRLPLRPKPDFNQVTNPDVLCSKKKRKRVLVDHNGEEHCDKKNFNQASVSQDIDDIFGTLQRSKTGKCVTKPISQSESSVGSSIVRKSTVSTKPEPTPIRVDKKLKIPIYTAESLNIGLSNSGNTPNCPFDCDCCF